MLLSVAAMLSGFSLRPEIFPISQPIGLIERGHPVDIYAISGRPAQREKMPPGVMAYCSLQGMHSAAEFSNKQIARLLRIPGRLLADCWKDSSPSVRLIC